MKDDDANEHEIIATVEGWLRDCVLELSLCPYARVPYQAGRVRFVIAPPDNIEASVDQEIQFLQSNNPAVETTLIIITSGLQDFLDFNDQLGDLEDHLYNSGQAEHFQLVGFHPGYLFAGEATDDASHFTNRAPYPVVHLLRADSVAKAVQQSDTLAIPEQNLKTLRALSSEQLRSLFPWSS